MCTTPSNNSSINSPTSICSGTYSGLHINADITIESGKNVTLTGPTFGSGAGITVSGGTLKISGIQTISGQITLIYGGSLEFINTTTINSNGAGNTVMLDNVSTLKVTTFTCNVALDCYFSPTFTATGTATFNYDVNPGSGTIAFTASAFVFNGYTGLDGKVTATNGITFGSGSATSITCCKMKSASLTNNAAANQMTGTAYIETGAFTSANALTPDSTIQLYKTSGSGNAGSATVLGSPITPSPC